MYGKKYRFATIQISDSVKKSIVKQLKNNEPVWFSWDVEKQFSNKLGILDSNIWKYNELYGLNLSLDKESRGLYRTHQQFLYQQLLLDLERKWQDYTLEG